MSNRTIETIDDDDLAFNIGLTIQEMRINTGTSQEALAEKVGTKQPAIARLENGGSLPSVSFLERVAKAMGYRITIKFIRNDLPKA